VKENDDDIQIAVGQEGYIHTYIHTYIHMHIYSVGEKRPLWWQKYAVTNIGTTVNRCQNEAWSCTLGVSLGHSICRAASFHDVMPTVITANTRAKTNDNAEVHFNESAIHGTQNQTKHHYPPQTNTNLNMCNPEMLNMCKQKMS
jgi:hypothetical protein